MTGKQRKKAIALRFDPVEDQAPVLIAKGQGYIAERIIELAEQHGVYVHTDKELVELLMAVELAETIPPQLYQVVARVLGMVYRVNRQLGKKRGLVE